MDSSATISSSTRPVMAGSEASPVHAGRESYHGSSFELRTGLKVLETPISQLHASEIAELLRLRRRWHGH